MVAQRRRAVKMSTAKEIIRKRKSIRKYDLNPLDVSVIKEVQSQIENLKPLYPDIKYTIKIVSKAKGLLNVKAPHYLIFQSEKKEGYLENIGFVGQQLDLYLSGAGLGSCWLGTAKPSKKEASDLNNVLGISFGNPAEPLYRELADFKRKPLADISEGSDERLEAARLAPSGINAQNWYFIAEAGNIHCYRKKANPILGFIYDKLACIDLGIAICHIAEESENFSFTKESDPPIRKGCIYTGTVV